jgi:hypothetical protein
VTNSHMSWYRFRVTFANGNLAEFYLYGRGDDVIPDAHCVVATRMEVPPC